MASKDKSKPPPFNYCDYRCDRCDERNDCRVYKENEDRLLEHYTKGEDPYDPQVFLDDIKDIFAQTNEMIKADAKQRGIDVESKAEEEVVEVEPEEYLVYQIAYDYYKEANAFIKHLETIGVPAESAEDLQDLAWYHALIAAKVGRLVSNFMDDFDEEFQKIEEEGTWKVINKGVTLSMNALQNMMNTLPLELNRIANLLALLKRLDKQLNTNMRQRAT